jgi:hypothetical protein
LRSVASINTTTFNSIDSTTTSSLWLNTNSRSRLLILDGHGSHTAIDFLWYCKQNKIHLLFLPAHTSHVLQPLDLGVFALLKSRYRSQIAALASLDDVSPVKKQRFITCYNYYIKLYTRLAKQLTILTRTRSLYSTATLNLRLNLMINCQEA